MQTNDLTGHGATGGVRKTQTNGATMAKKKVSKAAAIASVVGGAPVTMMVDPKTIKMDLAKNRQAGMDAESIAGLAGSIKVHGLLQPVMVNKVGDEFWCVFGHRRTLAAIEAGLTTIPAMVRENMSEKDIEAVKTIENEHQEDTSPIDKANSIVRLKKVGWNQNEIADMMETFPAEISRILSLLKLPADLQKQIHANRMTIQAGLTLVKAKASEVKEIATKVGEVVAELVANGATDPEIKRATTKVVDDAAAAPESTAKPPRKKDKPAAPAAAPAAPANKGNINDITPPAAAKPAADDVGGDIDEQEPKGKGKYQTRGDAPVIDEEPEPEPVQSNETSMRLAGLARILQVLMHFEESSPESQAGKVSTLLIDLFEDNQTKEQVIKEMGKI